MRRRRHAPWSQARSILRATELGGRGSQHGKEWDALREGSQFWGFDEHEGPADGLGVAGWRKAGWRSMDPRPNTLSTIPFSCQGLGAHLSFSAASGHGRNEPR